MGMANHIGFCLAKILIANQVSSILDTPVLFKLATDRVFHMTVLLILILEHKYFVYFSYSHFSQNILKLRMFKI